jgi:3',5'-cyclic-AMP phosphodiesterase
VTGRRDAILTLDMPVLLTRRSFSAMALAAAAARRVPAAAASTHWAFLSDIHVPADPTNEYRGFRPYDNLKKAIPEVVSAKPDGMLICGDIARLEGKPGDYDNVRTLVAPVAEIAPVALVLGNHDDRKNLLAAFASTQKGVQKVSGKHVAVIDTPSVRLVALDSNLQANVTPGLLGKAQRAWLQNFLAQSADRPTLLFLHHTLDDNDGSLADVLRFLEIVKPSRQVKAIVFGHSHRYSFDTLDGIHLVNLPALGYNFSDAEPVGWVDAVLRPDGGDFTLQAIAGSRDKHGKTVSLRWR